MRALSLATVVQVGAGSKFEVGDEVTGTCGASVLPIHTRLWLILSLGWTEYALMDDKALTKIV